jgi:hypothetical protein
LLCSVFFFYSPVFLHHASASSNIFQGLAALNGYIIFPGCRGLSAPAIPAWQPSELVRQFSKPFLVQHFIIRPAFPALLSRPPAFCFSRQGLTLFLKVNPLRSTLSSSTPLLISQPELATAVSYPLADSCAKRFQ